MRRFIVELEPGVWLAQGKGYLSRTLKKENARSYSRWQDAKTGLTWAQKYRPFEGAQIIEIPAKGSFKKIRSGGIPLLYSGDIDRFWSKVDKDDPDECWEWTGPTDNYGYGMFSLRKKKIRAHRVAYFIFTGKSITNKLVCHSCDNPLCVNPFHLWTGSHQDNSSDMKEKNRHTPGEKDAASKLTEEQVLEIRSKYSFHKYTGVMLGREYGVAPTTILNIVHRKTWKHI